MSSFEIEIEGFGYVGDDEVTLISLRNRYGQKVSITNLGGIVHRWVCPDRFGQPADILLGRENLEGYLANHPYFGAIVGRYANRIAFGKFNIGSEEYQLQTNLAPHHLHGGVVGFDKKIWDFKISKGTDVCTVQLSTISPHLEEGYPGNLMIEVCYTFNNNNELIVEYFAQTDKPTIVNLTNHCYFNLSGRQNGDVLDHEVRIAADNFTEVDDTLIPTGRIQSVEGSILDLRNYRKLSECILAHDPIFSNTNGFDHNYVVNDHQHDAPIAEVKHEASGRLLEVFTDQPGVQLYTGNWLGDVDGKEGKYKPYAGLCLETQHFPDSPNHSSFPTTLLMPGEQYYSKTIYKVSNF